MLNCFSKHKKTVQNALLKIRKTFISLLKGKLVYLEF